MVIKSLTITEDAYDALKTLKHGDESFSKTILRIKEDKANVIERYFGILKMSEKEINDWQKNIKKRREEINQEFQKRKINLKKIIE